MFERFTERARQVVVFADGEARALKHNYIGTEHILLGVLREREGLGARVLASIDITVERARVQVAQIVGQGEEVVTAQLPFTPRANKVLDMGTREADALDEDLVATHHLLLGLLREGEGVANRVLLDSGADSRHLRELVLADLNEAPDEGPAPISRGTRPSEDASSNPAVAPTAAACSFCGQSGRHMFTGFPPNADEVSICDLCVDLYHGSLSRQRGTDSPQGPAADTG